AGSAGGCPAPRPPLVAAPPASGLMPPTPHPTAASPAKPPGTPPRGEGHQRAAPAGDATRGPEHPGPAAPRRPPGPRRGGRQALDALPAADPFTPKPVRYNRGDDRCLREGGQDPIPSTV